MGKLVLKKLPFHRKVDKISFEWKSMFFCYHIAKAPSILKHIFKAWKPKQKLILYHGKVKETYFTSVKRQNFCNF